MVGGCVISFLLSYFSLKSHVVYKISSYLTGVCLHRRLLPVQHHPAEAHHSFCPLPASEPAPRGALRAVAALPARPLWAERRGGRCGAGRGLPSCSGAVLLHNGLQSRLCQDRPVSVKEGAASNQEWRDFRLT